MSAPGIGYNVTADGHRMVVFGASFDCSATGSTFTSQTGAFSALSVASGVWDLTFQNPPVEVFGVNAMLERGYLAGDLEFALEVDYYNASTGKLRVFLVDTDSNRLGGFVTSGIAHVSGFCSYRDTVA